MEETYTTGVVLTETERKIVEAQAEKLGLGARGFSAALRIIIRDWADATEKANTPAIPHRRAEDREIKA
jgi:hypothetical protein